MICPSDHKHAATGTCYRKHRCRCADCVRWHRAYDKQRREAIAPKVDVLCCRCGISGRVAARDDVKRWWCPDCKAADRQWFDRLRQEVTA